MGIKKKGRIRRVVERLADLHLDALLITDIKNIRYLTNFSGSSGFLFITEGRVILVTDFRYKGQAEEEVGDLELRIENGRMPDAVARLTEEVGSKRVGFEAQTLSFELYKKISERLNGVELKPTTSFIEDMRIVKEAMEITSIRRSIEIAEGAFNTLLKTLRPGMIERDIAIALEYELRKRGSGPIPFDIIVASGERSALPHATSSKRSLKDGDLLIIDWGAQVDGYNSDITRTFIVGDKGRFSDERKIYDIALEAQKQAIKEIRPGITLSALDAVARGFIKDAGYGEFFGHGLGHGIGLSVHESPHISWQGEGEIMEGMVFTIEPGIYIPNLGGVRIEDIVLVKEERAEVLTTLPRELVFI